MKCLRAFLIAPLLVAWAADTALAQTPQDESWVPFVGFAAAFSTLPAAVQTGCGGAAHATGELRAGLSRGTVALEGRGAWLLSLGMDLCLNTGEGWQRLPGGGYAHTIYAFSQSKAHTAADLRLRYAPQTVVPLVVAGGVGWLAPQEVPFVVTSLGIRSAGHIRLTADADLSWFRLPYDWILREPAELGPGGELSRERRHEWRSGLAVRFGTEISLW